MTKWVLLVAAVVMAVFAVSPCLAQDGRGFSVAPTGLEVTVPGGDGARAYIYITSEFDGELATGVEGIPFRVEPASIPVTRGDSSRKVELTVYSQPGVAEGDYAGKLTFLTGAGKNVAYGIKIDIVVKKTSGVGFVAEIFDRITGKSPGTGRNYTVIIILAVAVVVALAVGILIGRRFRRD
jgi:hypothetical protein